MINSQTFYTSPAKYWVEAMPLGNGSLGAMVFFDTDKEKISLNHDTLWSGVPKDYYKNTRKGAKESFERAKKLALDGKYFEAQSEIEGNFLDFNSEKYLPMGDLLIDFGHDKYEGYERRLDFESATATLSYKSEGVKFERSCFVSCPDNVMCCRICGEKGSVSFELTFTSKLEGVLCADNDSLVFDGTCPGSSYSEMREDNLFEYREGRYTKGISFRTAVKVVCEGGSISSENGYIRVCGADSAVIYLTAESNFVSPFVYPGLSDKDYKTIARETLEKAVSLGYEKLHKRHKKDFSSLYGLVKLDLGTSGKDSIPTDERLKAFLETKDDMSLYTLLFDFARYLTISASRKGTRAMNLQGIWNDKMPAPWRCNYTVNINTEMNYWPTLPSGLFECHEPLVSLIKTISKTGKAVAKNYYGARGFVTHHNVDIWGHSNGVPWKAMWGFWQGGSGWLTRHLFEQYEYTLDLKFLKKTAYPIIREAARFYMDIMTDIGGGKIAVVPGTSPENNFYDKEGRVTSVGKYSAMLNCIAYETLENAIKCCEILGIDDDFSKEAKTALERIQPLEVGSDGRLLEWNEEFPETEIQHRHISHLYALHPADMITDKTPELMEAARKTLNVRGDEGTGWSLGWKINFHARLGNGDRALELLERQLSPVPPTVEKIQASAAGINSGTYPNLFDAHPPFQIDGNFGLASGIYEMLARVIDNQLYLLPALPEKWRDGSIEGMRLKGGNILDMTWRDGKVVEYQIYGGNQFKVIHVK